MAFIFYWLGYIDIKILTFAQIFYKLLRKIRKENEDDNSIEQQREEESPLLAYSGAN